MTTITVNGDENTSVFLRGKGADVRYVTKWLGPWTKRPDLDAFLAWCLKNDYEPHLVLFYFGDEICDEIVRGSHTFPDYSGQVQSRSGLWDLADMIVQAVNASGIERALVNVEPEWNKRGPNLPSWTTSVVANDATIKNWDTLFSKVAWTLKNNTSQRVRIVTVPGSWGNVAGTLKRFPMMMQVTDYVGTQKLVSLPWGRHAEHWSMEERTKVYKASATHLISVLASIHAAFPTKGLIVTDVAASSYGGHFTLKHPYDGGEPLGAADLQADFFRTLADAREQLIGMNVEAVIVRTLRDNPKRKLEDYHGHAERWWGLLTSTGEPKPAFSHFMRLAMPPKPQAPANVSVTVAHKIHLPVVERGNGTACGTVILTADQDVTLKRVILAARPPGGTRGGGPYLDIGGVENVTLKANTPFRVTLRRAMTASDPAGEWFGYAVAELPSGKWVSDPASTKFTVIPECE